MVQTKMLVTNVRNEQRLSSGLGCQKFAILALVFWGPLNKIPLSTTNGKGYDHIAGHKLNAWIERGKITLVAG